MGTAYSSAPYMYSRFATLLIQCCRNMFRIPEIIYDPTLVLNPYIFLLEILFRIRAFKSPNIDCPENLYSLDILNGLNEQRLPLWDKLADQFVFCQAIREGGGV